MEQQQPNVSGACVTNGCVEATFKCPLCGEVKVTFHLAHGVTDKTMAEFVKLARDAHWRGHR